MITITFDATWWVVLVFIVDIVIRVLAIIIVPRNRRPTADVHPSLTTPPPCPPVC